MLRDPLTRAFSQFRHEANEHKTNASVSIFEGMLRRQIREFEACEKGLPPNSTMVYAWLRCFGAIGRQDGNWLSLIARSMYDQQVRICHARCFIRIGILFRGYPSSPLTLIMHSRQ